MSNPFALANLAMPALDGIIRALSDRGNRTEAERVAKAAAAMRLILSFLPRDVIEMMLSGQTVLFNELLADGARDTLREVVDTMKLRNRASVVSMGRLVQGHLDRLERRGNQPFQTEIAAAEEDDCPVPTDAPADAEVPMPPLPVAVSSPMGAEAEPQSAVLMPMATAPEAVGTGGGMPTGEPVAETSWLDEPYEQWRIETVADLAAKARMAAKPETRMDAGVEPGDVVVWPGMRSDTTHPALPRESAGYPPIRAPVDAAAD